MRKANYMFFIVLLVLEALVIGVQMHHNIPPRYTPIHPGIVREALPYVNSYKELASKHGIHFTKDVTVGYSDKKVGEIIGVCFMGDKFREIDLDRAFWSKTNGTYKEMLLYHELTHCLCGRNHDFGGVKKSHDYPPIAMEEILSYVHITQNICPANGYFPDGCAISIMAPRIQTEDCITVHYFSYIEEMFERCKPW